MNSNEITAEVAEWFAKIKAEGFKACIISNNGAKRWKK
jgi:predicted HAD superfamily phosphohydrolase YqeG